MKNLLIQTTRFGEIVVEQSQIIKFPQGIPGFMDKKAFIPIEYKEGSPFKFLQSMDEPDLAFVITDPFKIFNDYELDITKEDRELLKIEKPEDVNVYVIVTIGQGGTSITVNLQAPLVINITKHLGKQIILHKSPYPTRYPLKMKETVAGTK